MRCEVMGSVQQMQFLDDVILRISANIYQNSEILMYGVCSIKYYSVVFIMTVYPRQRGRYVRY